MNPKALLIAAVGAVAVASGCSREEGNPPAKAAPSARSAESAATAPRAAQATTVGGPGARPKAVGEDAAGIAAIVKLAGQEYALAVDDTGGIRLQVLSAFGMTVLDLAIHGDRYTVTMPLSHETRDGVIDLRALSDPAVPVGDRMIVALALMFRPKARADGCHGSGPGTVTCTAGAGFKARITVDERLRPLTETYLDADARPLLSAAFADYRGDDARALPGSLLIEDASSGARMAIQVKRVRTAATPA